MLRVTLHTINFAAEVWDNVFEYFLAEYKAGRPPNPDIMCNKEIKFKAFLEFAAEELNATILPPVITCSAQTRPATVTWLRWQQRSKLFFIHLRRKAHRKNSFSNWSFRKIQGKRDSTGICFIGERKFKGFLAQYLPAQPGGIETAEGNIIGKHDGLMYHTLGQRKDLLLP